MYETQTSTKQTKNIKTTNKKHKNKSIKQKHYKKLKNPKTMHKISGGKIHKIGEKH